MGGYHLRVIYHLLETWGIGRHVVELGDFDNFVDYMTSTHNSSRERVW